MFIDPPSLESVDFLLNAVTLIGAKASVTNVSCFNFKFFLNVINHSNALMTMFIICYENMWYELKCI